MRVPIFKITAAILLLTLCVCAVSCRSEEPQPANPETYRVTVDENGKWVVRQFNESITKPGNPDDY